MSKPINRRITVHPREVLREVVGKANGSEFVNIPAKVNFETFVVDNKLTDLDLHGQRVEYRRYANGGYY